MLFTIMDKGGAETMIMNYYRNIDRSKVQFDFAVHRTKTGAYDDEIKSLGGKIYYFPAVRPWTFGEYKRKISQFLDEHPEYRIIHSHCQELSYYFYKIAQKKGVPYIITHSHNASMLWDYAAPLRIYWRKRMFKYINIYFTCGKGAAIHYYGKELAKKATLMPNAIDVEKFRFNKDWRKDKRNELGIDDKTFVVAHIGRFTPQKNHPFLLKIFKTFTEKYPNSVLVLVGGEDKDGKFRTFAKNNGIKDKVKIIGSRSDISQLLSAFDCIVMPSLFEGVSVAMIEEQASGIPLITSTNVPKEVGLLKSTEFYSLKANVSDWVDAISKYMSTPRIDNAPDIVAEAGYDIKTNAKWLQDYYLSLK